jgi:hypothetical protein
MANNIKDFNFASAAGFRFERLSTGTVEIALQLYGFRMTARRSSATAIAVVMRMEEWLRGRRSRLKLDIGAGQMAHFSASATLTDPVPQTHYGVAVNTCHPFDSPIIGTFGNYGNDRDFGYRYSSVCLINE